MVTHQKALLKTFAMASTEEECASFVPSVRQKPAYAAILSIARPEQAHAPALSIPTVRASECSGKRFQHEVLKQCKLVWPRYAHLWHTNTNQNAFAVQGCLVTVCALSCESPVALPGKTS